MLNDLPARGRLWAGGEHRGADRCAAAPCRGYNRDQRGWLGHDHRGHGQRLWRLNNTTFAWEDVSKGPYNLTGSDLWSFAQFDNRVVAAQIGDPMQVITLGAGSPQFGIWPATRHRPATSRW